MSDEKRNRYLLTNHQNQPLELHLPSGVVVIGPRGEREILEADLAVPQVRVLARTRTISFRAIAPEGTTKPEPQKRGSSQSKSKNPEKEA